MGPTVCGLFAFHFSPLDDVLGLQEPAERSTLLGALALWKRFPGEPCALLVPLWPGLGGRLGTWSIQQPHGWVSPLAGKGAGWSMAKWRWGPGPWAVAWRSKLHTGHELDFPGGSAARFPCAFQGQAFQGGYFFPIQPRLLLGSINHLLSLCFTLQLWELSHIYCLLSSAKVVELSYFSLSVALRQFFLTLQLSWKYHVMEISSLGTGRTAWLPASSTWSTCSSGIPTSCETRTETGTKLRLISSSRTSSSAGNKPVTSRGLACISTSWGSHSPPALSAVQTHRKRLRV